jgi:hypothetical protein
MGVCGWDCNAWKVDPKVVAAKGDLSWGEYASQRKAYQEMFFTNAVRALTNAIYVYYPIGNGFGDRTNWDWDYKYMHKIADYPGISMYWGEFNTGWTGQGYYGMLSQVLLAHGYDVKFGKPLSYNWVNAGWGVTKPNGWADIPRYYGFLKTYYTSGMIGGIAGYFAYPAEGFNARFDANTPPHWLQQIETLSRVHAEFSYLEDILRNGDLLPGPDKHITAADQPAYEFRTGYSDTRVLVRKMKNSKRWLISAWAADGITRTVNVDIPGLKNISVQATAAGSLYDARIVNGVQSLTTLDSGSMSPSVLPLPNSQPDSDISTPYVPPSSINNLPVLSGIGSKSVDENSTLTFTLSATDLDADTLTYYASSTLPTGATFNNRTFTWTPTYTHLPAPLLQQ